MRVRYTPRARSDLTAILEYIDARSSRGARNVKRAIQKTIELIGEFPEGGRRAGEEGARVLPAGAIHISSTGRLKRARRGLCIFAMRGENLGREIKRDKRQRPVTKT